MSNKSKDKDFYCEVEKENHNNVQMINSLSNKNKMNILTIGVEKEKEKEKERDREREKGKMSSRGIVLSALKGHDSLFSSAPSPLLSPPPSLSFSLSVPVQMTAKDTIMQQRLNAFNRTTMATQKSINEPPKTSHPTSNIKTLLKNKPSAVPYKSKNTPTPVRPFSEKKCGFQIKNVTPKKSIKMKNTGRSLNSVTHSIESCVLNGKMQALMINNTDINRKTTVANVAASLAKMKENMSQCLPVNLTMTGQHNTHTTILERKKKFEKSSNLKDREGNSEKNQIKNISNSSSNQVSKLFFLC